MTMIYLLPSLMLTGPMLGHILSEPIITKLLVRSLLLQRVMCLSLGISLIFSTSILPKGWTSKVLLEFTIRGCS